MKELLIEGEGLNKQGVFGSGVVETFAAVAIPLRDVHGGNKASEIIDR